MASTKSTVVGIRLDHERRAWVEAEAARLGVSVRGLFEGMIDEARSSEADASQDIASLGSATAAQATAHMAEDAGAGVESAESIASERTDGVNAPAQSGGSASSSPWPNVGSVTSLPGGLLREAFSLTSSLIELGGR
ncbi:MAG: hypothetical protein WAL61_12895, partial [Acidimicrobiales bacterium]